MSDAALSMQRGTTAVIRLTADLNGNAFNVSLAGSAILVSFKRRRTDLVPLFTKQYLAGGGSTGCVLVSGGTSQVDVTIDPTDTAEFVQTEFLVWDAILTEPDARETAIAKGALTVRLGVGS